MVDCKKYFGFFFLVLIFVFAPSCKTLPLKEFALNDHAIHIFGRTTFNDEDGLVLISSGSGASFEFLGDSCIVWFKNCTPAGNHGYASIEMDGNYVGRIKITDTIAQRINLRTIKKTNRHTLKILKATEASNGAISILKLGAKEVLTDTAGFKARIEFIGNSITCGMGNDTAEIACGQGQWYDQHNAYYSYASIVSRALNLQPMISGVSGIGMYRCWDVDCPAMPDVYENLHLGTDSTQRWDFKSFIPDVVSICLGTNDFSDGDGVHARTPFDSAVFIKRYLDFIHTIYKHYPQTQIVLLTSPMLSGEKYVMLHHHLSTIANQINGLKINTSPIKIFQFAPMIPGGCSYHPSKEDHRVMADQLSPFLKTLIK